ncbi:succinoglycan biosynthesis transport protein [Rhizobium lusitanum]|uniref:Succinoglycan biosynthesis transport protein n=1 Tax=Rhizobium lusitanum TaxID=293958 RepID=A0A6L9TZC8_9HYPH|nr:succinoglycan biosynthesis transport protein [Rhizobium lusitanum]NEI68214.1 succinoglycan biosynthesis transport protein [Rhizobium lusitanum]
MFESKARTGLYPDDAESFEVSRRSDRRALASGRDDDGFDGPAGLPAANSDDPRDAELRAILRRMLDGDPYPVSGRRVRVATGPKQAQPGAEHIDDIRPSRFAKYEQAGEQASEPVPDLLEFVPDLLEGVTEPPRQAAAIPVAAEQVSRAGHWSLSIRALGFVAVTALAGAAIPTLLASPPLYVSQAVLHAEGEGAARQALLAVAAKRAVAPSVLSDVVARMKLDRDPEFTGARAGALGVAAELLSGSGGASDAPSRAQAALRKAIAVGTDGQTGLMRLIVTSGDPAGSADIANRLAAATLNDAAVLKAAGTSLGVETAVDRSRKEFDRASAALAEFKARYGEDKIAAALALQQQRQQLDGDIKAADLAVRSARARLMAAKSATPASVLSGALSRDLSSAGLDDLRSRYSAARAQLSQLSVQLGPRHPRLLAQQATVDDLAANIRSQLQRLAASGEADVKAALEKQAALSAQMTAAAQKGGDIDLGRLAQLQDAVAAAQGRYEADQQSAALTAPDVRPPLTVLSQAVASAAPLDDHLASNQAIGFLAGLGLALCAVFLRKAFAGAEPAPDHAADENLMQRPPALHPDQGVELPPFSDTASEPSLLLAPETENRPDVADEWVRIQQELAFLRAKVETYAARRHQERG